MTDSGNTVTRWVFVATTGGAALAAGLVGTPSADGVVVTAAVGLVNPFIGAIAVGADTACGKTLAGRLAGNDDCGQMSAWYRLASARYLPGRAGRRAVGASAGGGRAILVDLARPRLPG